MAGATGCTGPRLRLRGCATPPLRQSTLVDRPGRIVRVHGSLQVGSHWVRREPVIGSLNPVSAGDLRAAVRAPGTRHTGTLLRRLASCACAPSALRSPSPSPGAGFVPARHPHQRLCGLRAARVGCLGAEPQVSDHVRPVVCIAHGRRGQVGAGRNRSLAWRCALVCGGSRTEWPAPALVVVGSTGDSNLAVPA